MHCVGHVLQHTGARQGEEDIPTRVAVVPSFVRPQRPEPTGCRTGVCPRHVSRVATTQAARGCLVPLGEAESLLHVVEVPSEAPQNAKETTRQRFACAFCLRRALGERMPFVVLVRPHPEPQEEERPLQNLEEFMRIVAARQLDSGIGHEHVHHEQVVNRRPTGEHGRPAVDFDALPPRPLDA